MSIHIKSKYGDPIELSTKVNIEISPEDLGVLFAHMCSDEQAAMLVAAVREGDRTFEAPADGQWSSVCIELRKGLEHRALEMCGLMGFTGKL